MRGLFLKDIALIKNNKKSFIIALLILILFMSTGTTITILMGYVPLICCSLVMGTISYDEYDNGFPFLLILPISRKDYVKEKYFFGFFIISIGVFLSEITVTIIQWIEISQTGIFEWLLVCVCILVLFVVYMAICLPIQIKYGSDKGKIISMGICLSILAIGYLITKISFIWGVIKQVFTGILDWQFFTAVLVLAIAVLGISYFFSVHIMEKKEF